MTIVRVSRNLATHVQRIIQIHVRSTFSECLKVTASNLLICEEAMYAVHILGRVMRALTGGKTCRAAPHDSPYNEALTMCASIRLINAPDP
jgi:hypothetical protein